MMKSDLSKHKISSQRAILTFSFKYQHCNNKEVTETKITK